LGFPTGEDWRETFTKKGPHCWGPFFVLLI
jgi:hypothetical protein